MIKKDKKIKGVTVSDLARMIKEDVIDHMATKDDLKDLEERLNNKIEGVKNQLAGTNKRIDDYALNKVGYDKFNPLVKRVEVLEKT